MKTLKLLFIYSLIAAFSTGFHACKKDNEGPSVNVIYSVAVDGLTATFTNQTEGVVSYKWDFGDGTTSTEESPVHEYAAKGKYVPTLYVTTASGETFEGSTVLRLSKGSPVKLDDNSFSDWDTLNTNVIISGSGGGIFRKVKFDYDGEYLYYYIEMQSKKSNGDIFDWYIDPDNNPATGFINSSFPGGGFDVLIEGAMLDNWFDLFYHTGEQSSFSFEYQPVSDFYKIGTITESEGILRFEGSITRSKIKGLTGKALKIGITATKSDWSATLGNAPDDGSPAFYLDMSE